MSYVIPGKNPIMMSKEILLKDAKNHGYKPEIYEKVFHLLSILEQIMAVPYLEKRLVLKGGTALNLFCFDQVPRMSVDIDLNYIGELDRNKMLEERILINQGIHKILESNQFELSRNPNHHAGGKMVWRYPSLLGQKGNLEIDLNYMYRQPLWPVIHHKPKISFKETSYNIPVLDIHELAAGKLAALFSRNVSRDLFDAHHLLVIQNLDKEKVRIAFVIYLSMTDVDLDHLQSETIDFNIIDIRNRLLPVFRQKELPRNTLALKQWSTKLTNELKEGLKVLLPLNPNEIDYILNIRKFGKILPELITSDKKLACNIESHPAIRWRVEKSKKQ